MDNPSIFHLISDITQQEGVSCVLIGGFAINHYRVTRQTADVDLLITKEDFEKIVGFLEKAGYGKPIRQENFAQLESNMLSLLDVDFMFVDKETLEKIIKEGERFKIVGAEFIVPSLMHLIALKLHSIKHNAKSRLLRDFPDIVNLIKVNNIDIKTQEFKDVCLKYGTQELYQQIKDAL